MRIGRNIIISAILALGAAGSILASATAPAVVAQASSAHVLATGPLASPEHLTITRELARCATDGLPPIRRIRGRPFV